MLDDVKMPMSLYSDGTEMEGWEPLVEYNSTDDYLAEMAENGDNLSFTPPDTSGFGKYGGDGTDTTVDTDKAPDPAGGGDNGGDNGVDNGGNNAGNKGGNSAIFSDYDILNHTYVMPLGKGGDKSTYYKVVVEHATGGTPVSNEPFHRTAITAYITAVNIEQSVRHQVNYTLGNTVYLYTFGENVVNLTVGGFGFWECKDNGGGEKFDTPDKLLDFYKESNVSKHGYYCKVLLGEKTFLGYLIAAEIGFTDQALSLVAFKFNFIGVFQEDSGE